MRKIKFLFILSILLSINIAYAIDNTSFESKPQCLREMGNWRKFSSDCGGTCKSEFDEYAICAKTITYSCDCGHDKCWDNNNCILKSDYEKIYKRKEQEKKKKLQELREQRLKKFKTDPSYANFIRNLYPRPQPVDPNNKNKKKSNNNSQQQQQQRNVRSTKPKLRKIPPAYMQRQNNEQPINSNGQPQDLAFPVIPLPGK